MKQGKDKPAALRTREPIGPLNSQRVVTDLATPRKASPDARKPGKLVARGNKKLGNGIFHTNLPAGDSCPGKSAYCSGIGTDGKGVCYANKGFYILQRERYGTNLDYLRDQPAAYALQLLAEISTLKPGAVFRWHTSGDIDSVSHVGIIRDVCESRPDVAFYLYTRSWNTDLREEIERELFPLPNLTVWASSDATMPDVPHGWREASLYPDETSARAARKPVCPEQTGKRPDCTSCGLCWKAKPGATLAFIEH